MNRTFHFCLTALLPILGHAASDPFHHQNTTVPDIAVASPCGETPLIQDSTIEQYKPVGLIVYQDKPHILLKLANELIVAEIGNVLGGEWQISKVHEHRIYLRHCRQHSEKIWQL
ncbi:hypothetical protein [Spirabiliibacterium falconis]|uniref:hypothetical protein n=1 Tax=Spirabiliibacterium falconis TaxID=572023 RepID=UPI001AAC84FE|nr:hypothetical protein [Spirabiliibacterium falconis]MBE2894926.1 hypothetical protein [Spirabiliibacterium falconis]